MRENERLSEDPGNGGGTRRRTSGLLTLQECGFLWGTAGSGHQTEGNNVSSDIWLLEHVSPTIFQIPSGDATDSYHRIEEDLDLAALLGTNSYRLSIEWSRIEPEESQISSAQLEYYRRTLKMCHERGLLPFVTFSHFTFPRWFSAAGGFNSKKGIEPFVRYCRVVADTMGDLIGAAATFNEANIGAQLEWAPHFRELRPVIAKMLIAAADACRTERFSPPVLSDPNISQPIMLEAHAQVYDSLRQAGSTFPVGFTLALNDDQGAADDSALTRKTNEVWKPWISAPGDFIGVQVYTRTMVGPTGNLPPEPAAILTQSGYEYYPQALEAVVRKLSRLCDKPIFITENGLPTEDDSLRIEYIREALAGLARCRNDGCDVRGYFHWSLLDNWEWFRGYEPKFGLVSVNRTTFERTLKESARFYANTIASLSLMK